MLSVYSSQNMESSHYTMPYQMIQTYLMFDNVIIHIYIILFYKYYIQRVVQRFALSVETSVIPLRLLQRVLLTTRLGAYRRRDGRIGPPSAGNGPRIPDITTTLSHTYIHIESRAISIHIQSRHRRENIHNPIQIVEKYTQVRNGDKRRLGFEFC